VCFVFSGARKADGDGGASAAARTRERFFLFRFSREHVGSIECADDRRPKRLSSSAERSRRTRQVTCWVARDRTRGGDARERVSGGDGWESGRGRTRGDVPTGENSPVAAAKTARSISGASSVAMGAFLPGVADILVSAFPRREEPRVGASDAPVRAARRVHSADRVRAAHPHEHARREHRTGVAGATRAVAVTTLIVSSNQSRASLFARRSASPARSRGGRGVWVSSAERSRAERARREDRERVEMSDAPLL
jgi:hypothetical protein